MKRVTILATFNTMASTVIGPMDIFYQAGVVWNYFQGQKPTPFFETKIVTTNGKPLKCLNGTTILPDGSDPRRGIHRPDRRFLHPEYRQDHEI